MSYLAQGLQQGFGLGFTAANTKKLADDAKKLKEQEQRLQEDAVLQRHNEAAERRRADRQNEIEANNRFLAGQREREESAAARANDPGERLRRAQAEKMLADMNNPPQQSEADRIRDEISTLRLRKELEELNGTRPPAPATAKVRQPLGPKGAGGYAEFETPVDQVPNLARSAAAEGYRSPYARQLADLEKQIGTEQAAIDSGDKRTGFLGVGTARADTVAKAQSERLRLLGLELQDKVRVGILTQEEADAEADRLLSGTR